MGGGIKVISTVGICTFNLDTACALQFGREHDKRSQSELKVLEDVTKVQQATTSWLWFVEINSHNSSKQSD